MVIARLAAGLFSTARIPFEREEGETVEGRVIPDALFEAIK